MEEGDATGTGALRKEDELGTAPPDTFNLAYLIFFVLGTGFLLPWNAFITAVDYFDRLYPNSHIDRVFAVAYMIPAFILLLYLTFKARSFNTRLRINLGLVLYLLMMLLIPIMDAFIITSTATHYITIGAVVITGFADALVQGSLVGFVGGLPERYMQALCAGTAASGVLVSVLRITTKAALPLSANGLRKSANVYFIASVIFMVMCLICYNYVDGLGVIQYHRKSTITKSSSLSPLLSQENDDSVSKVSFLQVWKQIQWLALSLACIYIVTLSIFPGSLTEDVHSSALGDWYPVLLITCYNLFDLIGKSLTAFYYTESKTSAIVGSFARLLFFPLFAVCLHGPKILRSEGPIFFISCLLGITNGYFTSVVMMKAPKLVRSEEAEVAGIMMVVFLVAGLVIGSLVTWVWVL